MALATGIFLLAYPALRELTRMAQRTDAAGSQNFLDVDQQGSNIRVHWNRNVKVISQAQTGLLSIKDGDSSPRLLRLDADQLRTGSVMYSPGSNRVQFRLELHEPDGRNVSESVLTLNALRSAAAQSETLSAMPAARDRQVSTSQSVGTHPVTHPAASTPKGADVKPSALGEAETRPVTLPPSVKALATAKIAPGAFEPEQPLDKVIADVPRNVRNTIQGTVRVRIDVLVDASGRVQNATIASQGPSRYFARRALEAAQQCRFVPATVNGHEVASRWLVRFEFRKTGDNVVPVRISP